MKTIFADFNAMTEGERVCLTTRGSQEDIKGQGIQIGDHVWLSDGELLVGALVARDPRYVLVGVPAWDTLINLDDADEADFAQFWSRFQELSQSRSRTRDDETTILQLLATIERKAPENIKDVIPPGYIAFRRALALWSLGHLEFALQEIEEALADNPTSQNYLLLLLELLRRSDLPRALEEAHRLVKESTTGAEVLAACINVMATHIETLPDDEFEVKFGLMLEWVEKFQCEPDFETVRLFLLSQVWFNRGMALLRRNQVEEARKSFSLILRVNPKDQAALQATELERYDARARQLAESYRMVPVAAA